MAFLFIFHSFVQLLLKIIHFAIIFDHLPVSTGMIGYGQYKVDCKTSFSLT